MILLQMHVAQLERAKKCAQNGAKIEQELILF
jgi:hypothetical protein